MISLFAWSSVRFLFNGLLTTVFLTLIIISISILAGLILSLLYSFGPKVIRGIVKVYIEIFRNTPILLWIMAIRFMLPLSLFASGILSMSLVTVSGITEDFRSGINMIPKGQWEAAESQGMSKFQILRLVVLPQVVKKVMPILVTEAVTVLKQTSFLWAIGIQDLTGKGMILVGRMPETNEVILTYLILGVVYYILCEAIIRLSGIKIHRNSMRKRRMI